MAFPLMAIAGSMLGGMGGKKKKKKNKPQPDFSPPQVSAPAPAVSKAPMALIIGGIVLSIVVVLGAILLRR